MKRIPLTQGKYALVDATVYNALIARGPWCLSTNGYAVRTERSSGRQTTVYMHREVMRLHGIPARVIDHKDGDKLNNSRHNLRGATGSQNIANSRLNAVNRSRYKGVSWHRAANKWRACITVKSKHKHLGLFGSARDAALAYDKAAVAQFGRFARINFPERAA